MNPLPFSRRHFLKAAALTAAGLPFAAKTFAAEPKIKIGFALCGLGSLSTYQLAPALQHTEFARLTGIITGTPAKAKRWQAKYDLPDRSVYSYDTMARLADNPDIDVVYVVTPNGLHADHTIAAAKAGKHVLCEKPMEVSAAKCQQMIDACKTAGKQLAIGYRLHFEPNHLECIRLAREKVFGNLKSIEAGFGFPIGDPTQWRLNRALSGGGPMMDVGIYAWSMKFPSGVSASGMTTYAFGGINRFNVTAEHGSFGLEPAYNYDGIRGTRSDGKMIELPAIDQFAAEMDDFAQCILENRPTRVPGEEGLRDMKIITAIYESARTGKPVELG